MAEISKIQPFGSTTQYDLRDTSKLPLVGGTMTGNIIPNTNLEYSLGSSDKRWKIYGSLQDPNLSTSNMFPGFSNYNSGSFTFDNASQIYTITSAVTTSSWGSGVQIASTATSGFRVPWNSSYRISMEVYVETAHTITIDFNNYACSGSSWSGNDNDGGGRTASTFSIPAATWTKISWGTSNKHTGNTNQVPIYIVDGIGLNTGNDTASVVWKIRKVHMQLGDTISTFSPYQLAIKSISRNNNTFTATRFDGTSFTWTQNSIADSLTTSRTIWGQSFNGTTNVTGSMTDVGPDLKLPSGQSNFQFLTSGSGAANGKFGRLLLSDNYGSGDISNYRLYVNSGNAYISNLLTVNTGTTHYGIKLGDTYINAINGNLILQNNTALRFGSNDWDWNKWAGLKYDSTNKIISLGLADNSIFTANSAQTGGIFQFINIDKVKLTTNTGGIYKLYSSASTTPFLQVNSNNLDVSILKIDGNNPTDIRDSQSYGFNLKYMGTGSSADNTLRLYSDNSDGTDQLAMEWSGDGKVGIGTIYNTNYRLNINGNTNIIGGGLEIKGHIAGDTGTTGHGLYSGGGYHNAYNNIILHGDASTGSSGIAFVSDKVAADGTITTINQPSDRAFIQWHACGITTYTTENTNPTLGTSGEANKLIIGVGNDANDEVRLQTPGRTGLLHQVGTTAYAIPDTNNTTGTVGSTNQPVYVNAGAITAISTVAMGNGGTGNAYGLLPNNKNATNVTLGVGTWQPKSSTKYKYVWQQNWKTSDFTYTSGENEVTNTDTADLSIWLSASETSNALTANMNIDGKIYALGGFEGNLSGNASTATKLSNTPNNTTTFLRGDNTWSNTLTGGITVDTITISSTVAATHLNMSRTGGHNSPNYITVPASSSLAISVGAANGSSIVAMAESTGLVPYTNNTLSVGTSTYKWANMYATTFHGALDGNAATATKLKTARSLKTKLDSTTAVTFDGSAAQDAIPVTGTLGVSNGGTGATSLTSGAALIGNGTGAVTTRNIRNNTSIGALGWTAKATDTTLVTTNTIAYWNGAYSGTTSNLQYYKDGAFGTMAKETATDYAKKSELLDLVYPIGAIYISVVNTSPATLFGGTWEQIEDTFLLSAGTNHAAGTTGGSETVTLETANLPSHVHSVGAHAHSLNGHTHSGPSHSHGLNNHTHGVGSYSVASKSITGQVGQVLVPSSDLGYTSSTLYFIKKDDVTYPSSASEGGRRRVIGLNVTHNHSFSGSSGGNSGSTAANGTGATGGPSTTNTGNSSVFDSGAAGSGTAHNNMPPYLTVYMWKRTA